MLKLFTVCTQKNKHFIEEHFNLQDNYDMYIPNWYVSSAETSLTFKQDVEDIHKCDIILVLDNEYNIYTFSLIYEAYRSNKPIYLLSEMNNIFYNSLISMLGINYYLISDISLLPLSLYTKSEHKIINSKLNSDEEKKNARQILCGFIKEPTSIVSKKDGGFIFEWYSDPEKVNIYKYFIKLQVDLNCNFLYMEYYDELVYNKGSNEIDTLIFKINKFIQDLESLRE